jgi:hypothetical protein
MEQPISIEELKEQGAGRPAPPEIVSLYAEAFSRYGVQALWSRKPCSTPSIAMALVIAEALRHEGDMACWVFAQRIEQACRAAL